MPVRSRDLGISIGLLEPGPHDAITDVDGNTAHAMPHDRLVDVWRRYRGDGR